MDDLFSNTADAPPVPVSVAPKPATVEQPVSAPRTRKVALKPAPVEKPVEMQPHRTNERYSGPRTVKPQAAVVVYNGQKFTRMTTHIDYAWAVGTAGKSGGESSVEGYTSNRKTAERTAAQYRKWGYADIQILPVTFPALQPAATETAPAPKPVEAPAHVEPVKYKRNPKDILPRKLTVEVTHQDAQPVSAYFNSIKHDDIDSLRAELSQVLGLMHRKEKQLAAEMSRVVLKDVHEQERIEAGLKKAYLKYGVVSHFLRLLGDDSPFKNYSLPSAMRALGAFDRLMLLEEKEHGVSGLDYMIDIAKMKVAGMMERGEIPMQELPAPAPAPEPTPVEPPVEAPRTRKVALRPAPVEKPVEPPPPPEPRKRAVEPIPSRQESAALDQQAQNIVREADRRASVPQDAPDRTGEVVGHRRTVRLSCGHEHTFYTRLGWIDRGKEWFATERQMRSPASKPGKHMGFLECSVCGEESDSMEKIDTQKIIVGGRAEAPPPPPPEPRRRAVEPQDEPAPRRRGVEPPVLDPPVMPRDRARYVPRYAPEDLLEPRARRTREDAPEDRIEPRARRTREDAPEDRPEPRRTDETDLAAMVRELAEQMNQLRAENQQLRAEIRGSREESPESFFEDELRDLNEQLNNVMAKSEQLSNIFSALRNRYTAAGRPMPPPPPSLTTRSR